MADWQSTAPVSVPRRPGTWPRLLVLSGWVLLLHGGLATHWQRGHPTGLGHPASSPPPAPMVTVIAPRWHAPPVAAQETVAAIAPLRPPARSAARPPVAAPRRAPNAPEPRADPGPQVVPGGRLPPTTEAGKASRPDLPAQGAPAPAPSPNPSEPATPAPVADDAPLPTVAPGVPPPLYATRLPAAVTLRYALHDYGRAGEALLHWRHDGQRYALQFTGVASRPAPSPDGAGSSPVTAVVGVARRPPSLARPLVEQASEGVIDANGLAPDRFTDRRRGRGVGAANFRRDRDRIEFSGPATAYPAWPGAQDRLSWLVQLVAIAAAQVDVDAPSAAPAVLALFVVDARGGGELWRFDDLGPALADTAQGPVTAHHWRHLPLRPEGQQVDVWLDPSRGHWPAQLRFSAGRSAARFELRLDSP